MIDHIGPLALLFRDMADRIDHDRTSQTRYQAIAKAAAVVAARASAEGTVSGPLWDTDGADLLAAAYAFHAGLPRQAAMADHVSAMQEPEAVEGPHRALGLEPPGPSAGLTLIGEARRARVRRRDLLGGLLHEYRRAA
jgi:hypothetical protein